jgi:hypothetical protein
VTIRDIVENLPAHVVCCPAGYQNMRVTRVIAGDLMSDILVSVNSDALLVTSLATEQTVRSADIVGAPAILLVNDKLPLPSMKNLAEECGITLLATPMPMFESCVTLGWLLDNTHEETY